MSDVRLYMDEDAGRQSLVRGLRARGFDVLTTYEAGRSGTDDRAQLEFSTGKGRSIYTFNTGDFARLHKDIVSTGQDHGGIITVPRQRYPVGEQIKRLSALLATATAEEMRNRMEHL